MPSTAPYLCLPGPSEGLGLACAPRAPPRQLGGSRWPQRLPSGRTKAEELAPRNWQALERALELYRQKGARERQPRWKGRSLKIAAAAACWLGGPEKLLPSPGRRPYSVATARRPLRSSALRGRPRCRRAPPPSPPGARRRARRRHVGQLAGVPVPEGAGGPRPQPRAAPRRSGGDEPKARVARPPVQPKRSAPGLCRGRTATPGGSRRPGEASPASTTFDRLRPPCQRLAPCPPSPPPPPPSTDDLPELLPTGPAYVSTSGSGGAARRARWRRAPPARAPPRTRRRKRRGGAPPSGCGPKARSPRDLPAPSPRSDRNARARFCEPTRGART